MKAVFHQLVIVSGEPILVCKYDPAEVERETGQTGEFLGFSHADVMRDEVDPGPVYGSVFQLPGDRIFYATPEEAVAEFFQ